MGLTLGVLFGKVFSQTTVCRFEVLLLSLKNMGKQRPPLQKGVQETDNKNLQETYQAEAFVQARKRKRTGMESRVGATWRVCSRSTQSPPSSRAARWTNGSGLRKMCSECASATVARRANNRAVTILHARIWTLPGLLSQGNQCPFFWRQGPILVPQAMWDLTSLHFTLRSFP